ncbi:carbohydrate kinase family protein [Chryseobacterium paridis]|uniref:Carbohydrate kinase n=1 Tax=Chryseobacterium paridis TaxID=2800328 RepID=A0ABS1FV96_9FLAO|nr:carbohydrate kinase [Chryseobacterium paridis]MBK1896357.1 carbohydrate kinase [Chryseobacterium paridis]
MTQNNQYVVCFGEVLWDIFPQGSRAGGAPFNVAYNVYKAGIDVKVLSRIGKDDLGDQLVNQIRNWGISTDYIQIDDEKPTSTVIATIDADNEASYEIINEVAWDYIAFSPELVELVSNADAFIFGSLSARNEKTRETLFKLLEYARLKIFDVNFRPPFTEIELIKNLLHKTDIVKMNKSEMRQIMSFLNEEYINEDQSAAFIQNHFKINEIVLTKGSKGARYFVGNESYDCPAVPITIADTVGSGDSFLAGFISKRIKNEAPDKIMKEAIALGAFITSKPGACPDYEYEDFQKFRDQY